MYDAMIAETVHVSGHNGDDVEAYLARPLDPGPHGGMVVIHHMPGWDAATKEITRRFAALGYAAISPNLYYREAPGASPDDAAAAARAQGGVPDDRLVRDVEGAATHLRHLRASNGKVGVIGYCSGGRQAVLASCSLPLDAVVDCYGAFVVGTPPEGFPLQVEPLTDRLGDLGCPLLGLFGADDQHPSPADTDELTRRLKEHGKTFDLHTYDDAGHAFFAVDRNSYRPQAAVDGWARIHDFLAHHLTT